MPILDDATLRVTSRTRQSTCKTRRALAQPSYLSYLVERKGQLARIGAVHERGSGMTKGFCRDPIWRSDPEER
jgi:hypothetical protein